MVLPHLSVTIRRLHDTGRPGYYLLIPVITFIAGSLIIGAINVGMELRLVGAAIMLAGILLLIWQLVRRSEPDGNKYGPNPIDHPTGEVADVFD